MHSPSTWPVSLSQSCGSLIAKAIFTSPLACVIILSYPPTACLIRALLLPWREFLDTLPQAGNDVVIDISTHSVAADLWDAGNVEEVVLKDDYFYRAEIKYDLYYGHPWLCKNRVDPVGHRRCSLLQSGSLEYPEFRFLHAGFKSKGEFLEQKATPKFPEDITIAEVNGSAEYSQDLECLRGDSQARRPPRGQSSSYRVIDKWRDAICDIFLSIIPLSPSTMPSLTVRTSGLIKSFTALGPKSVTRSYELILCFT